MFERFTDRARKVMALANQEAYRLNHEYIGTEHILLGLVMEGSGVGANALKNMGVDLREARLEVEKLVKSGPKPVTIGKLPQSPGAKRVIAYSIEQARNLNHNYVGTEHLLLGLLRGQDDVAAQVLMNFGLKLEKVREEVLNILGAGDEADETSAMFRLAELTKRKKSRTPALDSFGRDLTQLAHEGELDPIIGRTKDIERAITVLCRRAANNPVLVGDSGVGKRAIVEGLALKIADRDVPDILIDGRIVELDLVRMVAGTKHGGFEERLTEVMRELRRAENTILFIAEFHTLTELRSAEGTIDAASILKPALSRGEIQCIGATTLDGYRALVAKDGALGRCLQLVIVDQPPHDIIPQILEGWRTRFQAHHVVVITNGALTAVVELTDRFLPDRCQPEKSISLLDEASALASLSRQRMPKELVELNREIVSATTEMNKAVRNSDYERAAEFRERLEALRAKAEEVKSRYKEEPGEQVAVDEQIVERALAQVTGLQLEQIRSRDTSSLPQPSSHGFRELPVYERQLCDTVLHGREIRITPGYGFILIPHKKDFKGILEDAILPAMKANGLEAQVGESISKPGAILNQVWASIRSAEVIVADVSGCNPNVIYELGLCFGIHRCPIILAKRREELPFNLQSLRCILYDDTAGGAKKLREELTQMIRSFLAESRSRRLPDF